MRSAFKPERVLPEPRSVTAHENTKVDQVAPTTVVAAASAALILGAELLPEATVEVAGRTFDGSHKAANIWTKRTLQAAGIALGGIALGLAWRRSAEIRADNAPQQHDTAYRQVLSR